MPHKHTTCLDPHMHQAVQHRNHLPKQVSQTRYSCSRHSTEKDNSHCRHDTGLGMSWACHHVHVWSTSAASWCDTAGSACTLTHEWRNHQGHRRKCQRTSIRAEGEGLHHRMNMTRKQRANSRAHVHTCNIVCCTHQTTYEVTSSCIGNCRHKENYLVCRDD